jgi:hypothetical protein
VLEGGAPIAIDGEGNAYIAAITTSTDFPMADAVQGSYGGGASDGCIAKLSSDGAKLLFSTYIGGSGMDQIWDIKVDGGGVYVFGQTNSSNFPTANAAQGAFGGGNSDAFVAKVTP